MTGIGSIGVASFTGTIRWGHSSGRLACSVTLFPDVRRIQDRKRLSLIWWLMAIAAMDAPGLRHSATTFALNSGEWVRRVLFDDFMIDSVH